LYALEPGEPTLVQRALSGLLGSALVLALALLALIVVSRLARRLAPLVIQVYFFGLSVSLAVALLALLYVCYVVFLAYFSESSLAQEIHLIVPIVALAWTTLRRWYAYPALKYELTYPEWCRWAKKTAWRMPRRRPVTLSRDAFLLMSNTGSLHDVRWIPWLYLRSLLQLPMSVVPPADCEFTHRSTTLAAEERALMRCVLPFFPVQTHVFSC
jgi:hypothetical protein